MYEVHLFVQKCKLILVKMPPFTAREVTETKPCFADPYKSCKLELGYFTHFAYLPVASLMDRDLKNACFIITSYNTYFGRSYGIAIDIKR